MLWKQAFFPFYKRMGFSEEVICTFFFVPKTQRMAIGKVSSIEFMVGILSRYISEKMSCQFLFVTKCAVTNTEDLVYCRGAVASTVLNIRQGSSKSSFRS